MDLRELVTVAARRPWAVLTVLVVAVAAAGAVALTKDPVYESTVVLALTLVATHEAAAQRARRPSRKPFAAFSESAERLKDSLKTHFRPAGRRSDVY